MTRDFIDRRNSNGAHGIESIQKNNYYSISPRIKGHITEGINEVAENLPSNAIKEGEIMATLEIGTDNKPSPDPVTVTDGFLTIVVPPGGCEISVDSIGGCPKFSLSLKDDIIIDFREFATTSLKYDVVPYGTNARPKRNHAAAHTIQIGNITGTPEPDAHTIQIGNITGAGGGG
jgi:hypothetical protein